MKSHHLYSNLNVDIVQIVDKESAIIGLAVEQERSFPLVADHSNICKFLTRNPDYIYVARLIKEMAEKAIRRKLPEGNERRPPGPPMSLYILTPDSTQSSPPLRALDTPLPSPTSPILQPLSEQKSIGMLLPSNSAR